MGMFLVNLDSVLQFITLLILFIAILAATFLTTRWIANYQKGVSGAGNIEVIEVKNISNYKSVEIVRIGEEYFALAVGKNEVNLIGKLDKEGLKFQEPQKTDMKGTFKDVLERFKNDKTDKN